LFERLERIEDNITDYFEHKKKNNNSSNNNKDRGEQQQQQQQFDNVEDADRHRRIGSVEQEGDVFVMQIEEEEYDGTEEIEEYEQYSRDEYSRDEYHDDDDNDDMDFHVDTEEMLYDEVVMDENENNNVNNDCDDHEQRADVEDGHFLELVDANDEMSSVGESGIYDSETDVSSEEEVELVNDDNGKGEDYDDGEEGARTQRGLQSSFSSEGEWTNITKEPIREKTIFEKPNPKLEKFLDRLIHFFELRRKIEERADTMDPTKKCQKIKVKAHSGGILNTKGKYKKEYQQRNSNDQLVRSLDDLYDAAQPAQTEFESFLLQMIGEINGLDERDLILPPLKPRDRAFEKAKAEYCRRSPGPPESWVYDIVRASVVCKTTKQLSEVNKWLGKNSHLTQAKNRFLDPVFNGYRDILYHVSIPYRDGIAHVCEIQVHHKDIYVLNEQYGMIKHYEFFRSCFANPWRSQEDTLADLSMMNKFGNIGGPLMKKLLRSEDLEQLRLFAGLCRDKLDEFDRSLELYRRILNLQEDTHGCEHEEMAATYLSIGLVLGALGDTDESLLNLLKALAIQESFLGVDHVEVADSYVEIGHMLAKRGDYSGAYTQYQRALMIREHQLGRSHFLVIMSLQDIGLVLQKKGDFEESEIEYRKALSIQEDVLGDGHPDLATTHALIGKTLCLYGDFGKAMSENRLALSIREKGLGKNHPTAAESHTSIGVLLFQRGDYKQSQWHHKKALRIRKSMLGKDDEECAISHGYLGEVLSRRGDYKGAVRELKRAQEIREANVGMDNPVTAGSYLDLGHIYCRNGKYVEALAQYRKAKVIRESILGQNHPDTALTYMCVGNALNLGGDPETALTIHRKALVVFESVLGENHPRTAAGYQSIADALLTNGNTDLALVEHRKALKIRTSFLTEDHPDTAESCSRIGELLLHKEDLIGALSLYRQALTITIVRCGNDHPESAIARVDVARVLTALGENDANDGVLDEAETKLQEALKVLRGMDGLRDDVTTAGAFGDEVPTGRACVTLGTLLEMKDGDTNEAEIHDLYAEGVERLTKVLGGVHPETQAAQTKLLAHCYD
jgi:tetratricopeptide (TPR) repeat protein